MSVLNTVPDNSVAQADTGSGWGSRPASAPGVLKNGAFAERLQWQGFDILNDNIFNIFAGGAINQCWSMEEVFIVKTTKSINNQAPKDFDLKSLGSNSRACDGDTCYFFIKNQKITNLGSWSKWLTVQGLDKITDYGTNLLAFAQAADWFQSKFGSYQKIPTVQDTLESIESTDSAPNNLWVNLPVITYDDAPGISSWKVYGPGTNEVRWIAFFHGLARLNIDLCLGRISSYLRFRTISINLMDGPILRCLINDLLPRGVLVTLASE